MNDSKQFDQDDLALFAMQLLTREEEAQVRALLDFSPDVRQELAELHGDLAVYATTIEMHSPPALARERLLTQIGREQKVRTVDQSPAAFTPSGSSYGAGPGTVPLEKDRLLSNDDRFLGKEASRESSGFGRVVPWLGWAVAAGLAVTSGNFYHESEVMREARTRDHAELTRLTADAAAARRLMDTLKDPTATRVTLTRGKEAPAPQGKVTYVADKGALLLIASNLQPLDTYKVYELWIIPANGLSPVAAGLFHPDAHGNASVVLPKLPTGVEAKAFGITIEDEGGSPTPTMPIVLSGAAAGA